jgi:hypothetical protein
LAKSSGGTSDDYGYSVCTDTNGNILVSGSFKSSTITFGSYTLINAGNADVFLVKYDNSGNDIWAKSAGGTSDDSGESIFADENGNVFVSGYFKSSTITFGSYTLTNAGNADLFIIKYDNSGNVLWTKSAGGGYDDNGESVCVDTNGNVFVSGYFKSSIITFGSYSLTNAGNADFFLVKYDNNGNVLWTKSAGGISDDFGYCVCADKNGNVFVTGCFNDPVIIFGSYTLINSWSAIPDIFLVKYNSNGNVLWAKKQDGGGISNDYSSSVCADTNGNVFVTGFFYGLNITFGSYTLTNAGGNSNIFVAKIRECNISVSTSQTNVICSGENNGSATANASGGTPPYTYVWSTMPVQTTQTVIGLSGGNYIASITDSTGCVATTIVNITEPAEMVVNNPQTICDGDFYLFNGNIYITSGTYFDTLVSVSGCDSIIETFLSVTPIYTINNPQTIFYGDSLLVNGNYYSIAGIYYDTLFTLIGCDSIIITELTIVPYSLSALNGALGDTLFVPYYPFTLDAGSGFQDYLWSTGDHLQLTQVYNDDWYIVTVTYSSKLILSDSLYVQLITASNLYNSAFNNISIYPNPTTKDIYIKIFGLMEDVYIITLYDMQGKTVNNVTTKKQENLIDISMYPQGIYWICILSNNIVWRDRIIKQVSE